MADAHDCAKRNSHNRTFEEINKVSSWSLSNTRRSVSSELQTPRSYTSNMRTSVSSDFQILRSNISRETRRSVSSDIQTLRSNISNTRSSVSSDIPTQRSDISITRWSVSSNIQTSKRVELLTSWRSMFLKLIGNEGQKCPLVRRFKIPVKGWAEASLTKCCPIWCAKVTCRRSVLQVGTGNATLQKMTSFLRKLLLNFRWYRLGRRLQFIS